MKSYLFTAVIFLVIAYKKCGKPSEASIPSCVQAKIEEIKKQPKWNPPASVEEYQFNGRRVFLFSADCCDQLNAAFDDSCNFVCAPSGGLTGKGDGKCADFKTTAQLVKVIWKDDRK